ncbi:MAG: hypothetical protein EU551_01520 [Promethearchaeota archaeon]|nr:MAG: hypothetical protein EU551_01520 [Candidatus Lokiarchaeota archaeon]
MSIVIAFRAKKLKNFKGFLNSFTPAIILLLSIFSYFYMTLLLDRFILVFPLDFILVGHFLAVLGFQQIYIFRVKRDKSSENENEKQIIEKSAKDFTPQQEGGRKALHLLGFLLVPPYFGMGLWYYNILRVILDFFNAPPMNINPEYIPQTIALLGILTAFIFVMVPELYRMFKPNYCMLQRFIHILREDEINALGPHVNMICGVLIPIILIPEPFLAVGTMLSIIIADGAASVIGKKWGKRIFNKKNNKTYEGLFAGIATNFLVSFIFYIIQYPVWQCLIFSGTCCIIFGVLDYISFNISDNILNPVISGIAIALISNALLL